MIPCHVSFDSLLHYNIICCWHRIYNKCHSGSSRDILYCPIEDASVVIRIKAILVQNNAACVRCSKIRIKETGNTESRTTVHATDGTNGTVSTVLSLPLYRRLLPHAGELFFHTCTVVVPRIVSALIVNTRLNVHLVLL